MGFVTNNHRQQTQRCSVCLKHREAGELEKGYPQTFGLLLQNDLARLKLKWETVCTAIKKHLFKIADL